LAGPGRVYIVGAGPGDPELITVKGLRLLRSADAVVYDRLVPGELLGEAKRGARLVYAGKAPGRHAMSQDEINRLLEGLAREGLVVVRLHGGDPLTFGRGEEECAYLLSRGIPCEVVPGIPSYVAASAEHLLPLGSRGYSRVYTVATGTLAGGTPLPRERLEAAMRASDSLVVLMAASRAAEILGLAAETLGPQAPAAIVESASTPKSKLTLGPAGELAATAKPRPPALIYIGGAVRWRLDTLPTGRS